MKAEGERFRREKASLPCRIVRFYVSGFREMTVGRTLWIVVLLKLLVMFAVLKLFFFPDLLAGKSPEERATHAMEELTQRRIEN
ncbi:MAG: DUF4492 domain-containing protein [Alistipes sp.]|nr:DUF4492 domain-containing protein [Alistipes sp.]